ncbi:hypothetical protein DFS33DRAFT_1399883 [Desarmillaria ectypa]|nr:hypothetical protein DFS33DRAFT_1399883 [Desarmillaria ectypa]
MASVRALSSRVIYWPNRNVIGQPVPPAQGGYTEWVFAVLLWHLTNLITTGTLKKSLASSSVFEVPSSRNTSTKRNSSTTYEPISYLPSPSSSATATTPLCTRLYAHVLNNIGFDLFKIVVTNVGGITPHSPARENPGKTSPALADVPTPRFDQIDVEGMQAAICELGALPFLIGPKRGRMFPKGGKSEGIMVYYHFEGQRSMLFDAAFVPSGVEHANILSEIGRTAHWIRESFGHCKAIGAIGDGAGLVRNALGVPGVRLSRNDNVVVSYGVVTVGNGNSDLYSTGDFVKGEQGIGFCI